MANRHLDYGSLATLTQAISEGRHPSDITFEPHDQAWPHLILAGWAAARIRTRHDHIVFQTAHLLLGHPLRTLNPDETRNEFHQYIAYLRTELNETPNTRTREHHNLLAATQYLDACEDQGAPAPYNPDMFHAVAALAFILLSETAAELALDITNPHERDTYVNVLLRETDPA